MQITPECGNWLYFIAINAVKGSLQKLKIISAV
jgi:hypothetical protein